MSETTSAQPRTQGLTPYISVSDANAAIAFYEQAFGARVLSKNHPGASDPRVIHSALEINGSQLFVSDFFPEYGFGVIPPQAFNLHLQVDDADAWWRKALAAGATVISELKQEFWGDYYGQLKDPFGVTWAIGQTPKSA